MEPNNVQLNLMNLVKCSVESSLAFFTKIPEYAESNSGTVIRDFRTIAVRLPARQGTTGFLALFIAEHVSSLKEDERILITTSIPADEIKDHYLMEYDGDIMSKVDSVLIKDAKDLSSFIESKMDLNAQINKTIYKWILVDNSSWLSGKDQFHTKLIQAVGIPEKTDQFFILLG